MDGDKEIWYKKKLIGYYWFEKLEGHGEDDEEEDEEEGHIIQFKSLETLINILSLPNEKTLSLGSETATIKEFKQILKNAIMILASQRMRERYVARQNAIYSDGIYSSGDDGAEHYF